VYSWPLSNHAPINLVFWAVNGRLGQGHSSVVISRFALYEGHSTGNVQPDDKNVVPSNLGVPRDGNRSPTITRSQQIPLIVSRCVLDTSMRHMIPLLELCGDTSKQMCVTISLDKTDSRALVKGLCCNNF
jgi:hypothetical protein